MQCIWKLSTVWWLKSFWRHYKDNTPDIIILENVHQFKLTKTTVDKAWQQSITNENVQRFTRRAIQKKFLTTTQFRAYVIECEHILTLRPLVYINDDIRSTEAITPNYFLCLNPKNSAPILEDDGNPDFKPQTESADELLEIGGKDNHIWLNFGSIGIITIWSV